MSWAKFDDHFDDDPDCDIAGEIGICLFLCSITWSSRNLTDGFIPAARVKKLPGGADKAALAALLSVAWWVQVDGGYQIRNFLKFNPCKEKVLADREKERLLAIQRAEAGRNGGYKSGQTRAAKQHQNGDKQQEPGDKQQSQEPKQEAAQQDAVPKTEANDEANSVFASSKNEANNAVCFPKTEANGEPPVSRIPYPESRLPNPAAAAPPTSPPQGESPPGQIAAAAVSLRFSGQSSSGMSALRSALPAIRSPEPPEENLSDRPPLLILSSEEADAAQLSRELRDYGVSRQEADLLVAEALRPGNPFSWNDIRDQICWMPHQNAKNPGYWLPRYIRDGRAKPKALADAERQAKQRENQDIAAAGPSRAEQGAQKQALDKARLAYQETLTEVDAQALETAAEAAALEHSFVRDHVRKNGRETRSWQFYLTTERNKIIDGRLAE